MFDFDFGLGEDIDLLRESVAAASGPDRRKQRISA
jgi:hypothetical protein